MNKKASFFLIGLGFLVTSLFVIGLRARLLEDYHAVGQHAIGLFFPYTFSVLVTVYLAFTYHKLTLKMMFIPIASFLLTTAMFGDLLFQPVLHYYGDDSWDYSKFANFIIEKQTLNGGEGPSYIMQPGFRYFLASTILLFGEENRLSQSYFLFLALLAVLLLIRELCLHVNKLYLPFILLLILLYSPFTVKNALMTYSEWLTLVIFIAFILLFVNRRYSLSLVFIALIVFFRQNTLFISLFLAGYTLHFSRNKAWDFLLYLSIIFLPVYHNYYYGSVWQWLSSDAANIMLKSDSVIDYLDKLLFKIVKQILEYLGVVELDWQSSIFGVFFAPLSVIWILMIAYKHKYLRGKLALIVILTTAPTFVGGWGSYPRFIYVNLAIILLSSMVFLFSDSFKNKRSIA
jgi:hypothetical protein